MRKLAREAVIFMLLTPIVVFVSSFAYFYHDAHKSVRFPPPPAGYTLDPAASSSTPASEMLGDSLLFGDSDEGDRGSGLMVISVPGSM
jgi:hypothetical protein